MLIYKLVAFFMGPFLLLALNCATTGEKPEQVKMTTNFDGKCPTCVKAKKRSYVSIVACYEEFRDNRMYFDYDGRLFEAAPDLSMCVWQCTRNHKMYTYHIPIPMARSHGVESPFRIKSFT